LHKDLVGWLLMQGAPLYEQKGVAQRRIAALAAVLRMARVNVHKPHCGG